MEKGPQIRLRFFTKILTPGLDPGPKKNAESGRSRLR